MPHSSAPFSPVGPLPAVMPGCELLAGDEPTVREALARQAAGPVAFDLTADCQEGAPPGREAEHATMLGALIAQDGGRHGRVGLRIHDSSHRSWHGDLEIVIRAAGDRLAYVTVPRVDGLAGLERVVSAIDDVALQCGVRRQFPVHVQIETHGGLAAAEALAAHPRVQCVGFELSGYLASFQGALPETLLRSPAQFEHPLLVQAKARVSAAAHAAGKVAGHPACLNVGDPEQAYRDASRARDDFGFTRVACLTPAQIEPVARALRPNPTLVAEACALLMAARARDWQPVIVDGHRLDHGQYRYWWTVLARARAGGERLADDVEAALFPSPTTSPPRKTR